MDSRRGFTLIELMVVIAIIGLLSAVILASLNTARGKGGDAAIKNEMHEIQNRAAVIYDSSSPNSYSGLCTDSVVVSAINVMQSTANITVQAPALIGTASSDTVVACHVSASNSLNFAIETPLRTSSANSWCMDDSGMTKQETGATNYLGAAAVACP